MTDWLDPLIFFHQGNVPNTVECSPRVGNLSCVSFVTIFVSRLSLWESDRIECFVAYFFCLDNLGRNKSRFYPFGQKKVSRKTDTTVDSCKQITRAFATCPPTQKGLWDMWKWRMVYCIVFCTMYLIFNCEIVK